MREIKFRAKRLDNNEWIYGYYAFKDSETSHYILTEQLMIEDWLESYFIEREINEETLGQFTGLYDKNGIEIYEGDIVDYYGTCKVEFKNGTFGYIPCNLESVHEDDKYFKSFFNNEECEYYEDFQNSTMKRFKVIGNIYDNKELLKGNE